LRPQAKQGESRGAQICVCDKEVGKDRARPTRVEEYASEFSLRFSLSARPGASQLEQKTWRLVDATNSTRFGPQSDEAEPTQLMKQMLSQYASTSMSLSPFVLRRWLFNNRVSQCPKSGNREHRRPKAGRVSQCPKSGNREHRRPKAGRERRRPKAGRVP
jgi:hypothetical protein